MRHCLHLAGAALLLVSAVLIAACATPDSVGSADRNGARNEAQDNPMVGRTIQDLVGIYGQPSRLLQVGIDRTAYVYNLENSANDTGEACNDAYVANGEGVIVSYFCR